MAVKAKERINLVHFLMMPIAYKRIRLIYLVYFKSQRHQPTSFFFIPYKPSADWVELGYSAPKASGSVLLPYLS